MNMMVNIKIWWLSILFAFCVQTQANTANRATQSTDTAGKTRAIQDDSRGNVTRLRELNFTYDYSDQPTQLIVTRNFTQEVINDKQY